MKVLVDLCVVPIGIGVSVSKYIAACEKIISDAGLKSTLQDKIDSVRTKLVDSGDLP